MFLRLCFRNSTRGKQWNVWETIYFSASKTVLCASDFKVVDLGLDVGINVN